MPRRPPRVRQKVPLFLIPPVIQQEICQTGEELERIVVRKTNRHYYCVSIHTRSVKRELRDTVRRAGVPEYDRGEV